MKVALAQLAPKLLDKEANLSRIEKTVAKAGADLAMFGELFLTGYMARDAFPRLAETVPGPATDRLSKIASEYGTHVLVGMPERDAKGRYLFNTSVLVAPDGEVWRYRKIHPANFGPFEEGLYFGRGSDPVLVDTRLGKLGLLICYDAFFPELAKAYALQGADALAIISASPATSKPFFDKILPARAIENTVFVLYANLVGTELNIVFQGGTQAIGPRGEDLGRGKDFEEDVVIADVDLRDLRVAREFRPTLRDTRRDLLDAVARKPSARKPRRRAHG
jgi:predicted amidohydrolase